MVQVVPVSRYVPSRYQSMESAAISSADTFEGVKVSSMGIPAVTVTGIPVITPSTGIVVESVSVSETSLFIVSRFNTIFPVLVIPSAIRTASTHPATDIP